MIPMNWVGSCIKGRILPRLNPESDMVASGGTCVARAGITACDCTSGYVRIAARDDRAVHVFIHPDPDAERFGRYLPYRITPNLYTVVCRKLSPGSSMQVGKFGWFIASG